MKRLEKDDLITTIYGLRDLRTFLIGVIIVLAFLLLMTKGSYNSIKADYDNKEDILLEENLAIKEELEITKKELEFFKEENLMLYKDYTKHCQLYHQDSMINPVDMRLVFIDGDTCYYDRYHNNALYYMNENGILIPLYNEDGSTRTFDIKEK